MANRNSTESTIKVKPSDLATITEDQLGAALANLRREMRNATGEALKTLQSRRDELSRRLDQFVMLQLSKIDRDPEIKAAVDELSQLSIDIQKAVREMKSATKALNSAAKVIRFADQFLAFVLKLTP